MKEKIYAVDSTKGSSMINPLNYKGDVLVQVWVDSRVLATIVRWMDSKGNYPRFMSQGVRRPLEVLTGFLVDNGEVDMVEDTDEARKLLTRRFNVELNRGGRGAKNVMHNLSLSGKRNDLGERIQSRNRINDVNRPMRKQRDPRIAALIEKGQRIYKELFPDKSKETKHYDYSESKEEGCDKNSEIIKELERIERGETPYISQEYTMRDKTNDGKRVVKNKDEDRVVKSEDAAEFVETTKLEEVRIRKAEEDIPLLKEKGNSREVIKVRIRKADEESQKELDALNNMDFTSLIGSAVKEK